MADEKQVYYGKFQGTLMVFSKWRLFLLFLTSMLVGTSFFFFGFYFGYKSGKQYIFRQIKQKVKEQSQMDAKMKKQLSFVGSEQDELVDSKYDYIVHIGLFTNMHFATNAWKEIADFSRLTDKESIKTVSVGDSKLYQVVAGRFKKKADAQAFVQLISRRTHKAFIPAVQMVTKMEVKDDAK